MGTLLATTGSEVPNDFPAALFDLVCRRIAEIPGRTDEQWRQFGPAWNAVAYRFLAVGEADDLLRASFATDGSAPPPSARTRQELQIFSFVSAACSTLESLAYAIFALGAILTPNGFPMASPKQIKNISFSSTVEAVANAFPADPLADTIRAVYGDPQWAELSGWRNVAIHRVAAGRLIQLTTRPGPGPPDMWRLSDHGLVDVELTAALTGDKRQWLADGLGQIMDATDAFLTRRGVS